MQYVDTKTLIVNKRHDDDEYGIVTLSGIARHVLAVDRSPERTNIYEIMTKPALTVHPDMDIRYCSRLFAQFSLVRDPFIRKVLSIPEFRISAGGSGIIPKSSLS